MSPVTEAWITARESLGGRPPSTSTTAVRFDQPVSIGRAGRISLGVGVPDSGISRIVATVTATPEGWTIQDTSRNGIIIHPWGLAPVRATAANRALWPLIGLRVLGAEPDARHWVLLECDHYPIDGAGSTRGATTTIQTDPPRPLTAAEQEALHTVFESTLAWPPLLVAGDPLQLKQAGRKLRISASAVKVRLEGARAKAEALGLEQQVGVTDPTYLHTLVAAGYLHPPAASSSAGSTVRRCP
jgi:hypothetical protein